MPKINLAQETMRNQAIARRRKVIYSFSLVFLALVGLVYLGAVLLTKNTENKIAEVKLRVDALEAQLKTREPAGKEIKAFSQRLVNMTDLLKKHVKWSFVFSELERLVLPAVTVKSLTGGADAKEITMDVQTPTIESAADLVVSLENIAAKNITFFSNVTATALTANTASQESATAQTGGKFTTKLKFSVKPEGFQDKDAALVSETETVVINSAATPAPLAENGNQLNP